MPVVVSTVPPSRFQLYDISFPAGWEVRFTDAPYTDETLIQQCQGADYLFVGSTHAVSAQVIEACPSLRFLQVEGVGFDKVDAAAAAKAGLPVCNNQGVNAVSVAEFTVGLMLAGLRRMAHTDRLIKEKKFAECQAAYRGRGVNEIISRRVGLVGCGAIGRNVARMLMPFGCTVVYFDEFRPTPEQEKELNLTYVPLDELIRSCDVISLHVPVLPNTINMISKPQLEMMKPSTLLINASRGEVLDQYALAEALEAGRIYGAAIDTLSPEPPGDDHPLLNMSQEASDRLLLTPHVAGTTNEAFTDMLRRTIANMERVERGEQLHNIVNGVAGARLS
ncbi:MAG: glycerate dehydrogenase [Candidatus Adiutrix sp.]|jgi:phosphoglycerate dehydrogenase-like enzyme|nr:glycerate dehydrogenase [Candidatus Adiutrix sp.]